MAITTSHQWWRSAVIYQIYPKSWADGSGDGIGDIAGMRSRLAYLSRLGVDAIWISPWYCSPQADGGYDVSDHRDIDPLFGTVAQARALIVEAHDLGLKVIADIVPNHLSDRHKLFQEALATPPGSPQWQLFHCVAGSGDDGELPPNDWPSVFGGPAWSQVLSDGEPTGYWYLHLFAPEQPDLNWDHPAIIAEYEQTLRFWFDLGVDGFRIDVATALVKEPGYPDLAEWETSHPEAGHHASPYWDLPGVHEIWRSWRRIAEEYTPPRAYVGEVWCESAEAHAAYLRPDELHTAFNFAYLVCPWDAELLRAVISETRQQARLVDGAMTWVLDNHDVVRSRTRYGLEAAGTAPEVRHGPALGDPDDPAGLARARAALLFMLGLPGSAYIYQGQELGLPEVLDLPDSARQDPAFTRAGGEGGLRDGARVPMPWDRRPPSFGFSDTGQSWLPQPPTWGELSVAAQADDPDSTLELTRRALRIRRGEQALGDGDFTWLSDAQDSTLVLRRDVAPDDDSGSLLVAMNMGSADVEVPARAVVISSSPVAVTDTGVVLPPNTAAWLRPLA